MALTNGHLKYSSYLASELNTEMCDERQTEAQGMRRSIHSSFAVGN